MLRFSQNQSRSMLALLTVMAVALSACGGGSGTPSPSGGGTTQPSATGPNASGQPGDSGSGLNGAAAALAGVDSYKFAMIETGGSLGDTLSMLPISSSGTPSFTISGTVVLRPDKAADITVAGILHVISTGGFDYQDINLTGAFTKNDSTTPSLIDSLAPEAVFSASFGSSFDFATDFDKGATESKNSVDADHYVANDNGKAALAEFGSVAGIMADKWAAEIWIAKSGGYPVRMTMTATSGASVVYERTFDITKVNDAANKVTAPTNVTGA
jgi:hypothetical protein